jgi:hypothetical protein
MQDHNSEDKVQFSLSISTDRDKFFRRTCPSCGRDFKTEIDEADIAWAIAPQFRRMGIEIGSVAEKDEVTIETHLHCPYCQHDAEASEMLTQEIIAYLHRFVMREHVLPMMNNMFSELDDVGSRSGGFISVRFEHSRSIYPPRPIHGPEPPDMKIIEFMCCGKRAKVAENWNGVDKCVFCGTPITLV